MRPYGGTNEGGDSMKTWRLIALLLLAVAMTLAFGAAAPREALADSPGMVTGHLTGFVDFWFDEVGNPAVGELRYQYALFQTAPDGTGRGWAHAWIRVAGSSGPWVQIFVEMDCVRFTEADGKPAAIYSGRIARSTMYPDYALNVCNWEGQLKIGMLVDGGTGGDGDRIVFWQPQFGCFYPDTGIPLACQVPAGATELEFRITGGDVEIRP